MQHVVLEHLKLIFLRISLFILTKKNIIHMVMNIIAMVKF